MIDCVLQYFVYVIREDGSDNVMRNEPTMIMCVLVPEVHLAYINRKKDLILLCSLS
jgi:hypothetical protein